MNVFEKVIVDAIHDYFVQNDMEIEMKNDFKNVLSVYYHNITKKIDTKKRKVFISRELQSKIDNKLIGQEYLLAIDKFKSKFESGLDINGNLSKQIYNGRYYDKLLICWQIHHLHLNTIEAQNKDEMSNNRSDMLLFCRVNRDSVYFIDAESHNKKNVFSMFNLLEIISNNWIGLIDKYEIKDIIPGTMQPLIKDDETLHELWKSNINTGYKINNKYYNFADKGLTTAGTSSIDTINTLKINRKIREIKVSPPVYARDIKFILDTNENQLGILSWYEGKNKKQIIL